METIENLKQQKELPVIITDDQGIVIYVNDVFERVFGWSQSEIAGQALTVILPAYFQDAHNLGFSRFSATGFSTILNHPLLLKAIIEGSSPSIVLLRKSKMVAGYWRLPFVP